jgi:AcrR family transcriptional regulator
MARAGLTADRVADAAADLADAVGFDNVTVSALARSFGVADASLYAHVRNVRDLRTRVAMRAARDFADSISAAVAGRSGRKALVAFADAYRAFALAHPGRYAATQIQLDPEAAAGSIGHARIVEATYATLRAYGLTEPDLTDAVRLLRSTFHGFVSLERTGGFGHPRDITLSWDRTVDALAHLLDHWPTTSTTQNT